MKHKYFFIAAFGLLVFAPVFSGIFHIEVPIKLANTEQNSRPSFSITSFFDSSFQSDFEAYWNSEFPNHNLLVKTYNQLRFSLFSEGANPYLRGKANWIHDKNYIEEALCTNPARQQSKAALELYADSLERVMRQAQILDKKVCFVLTANKVNFERDSLPLRYKYTSPVYDITNADLLRSVLRERGIPYVDGESVLKGLQDADFPFFGRGGIHWTTSAAVEVLRSMFDHLDMQANGEQSPRFSIEGHYTRNEKDYIQDDDIWTLLNIFSKSADSYTYPLLVNDSANIDTKWPHILIQGGSFCFPLLDSLKSVSLADKIDFLFYETTHYTWNFGDITPSMMLGQSAAITGFEDVNINELVRQSDWIILEINEEYLSKAFSSAPAQGSQYKFIKLVDQALNEILTQKNQQNEPQATTIQAQQYINFRESDDGWQEMSLGRGSINLNPVAPETKLELRIPWKSYITGNSEFQQKVSVFADEKLIASFMYQDTQEQYVSVIIPEGTQHIDLFATGIMDTVNDTQDIGVHFSLFARLQGGE